MGAMHGGGSAGVCACACLGEIKDMTCGNDAKFHLFVFFCKVALTGPSKFKNRAFLMKKRAEGKRKKSESLRRLDESSVVGECNLRLARLLFLFFLLSSPPPPLMRRDMHRRSP